MTKVDRRELVSDVRDVVSW